MASAHRLRPVQELDPVWITLPDRTRLAAKIWLPEDAAAEPVPAILEYLPYRRRDATSARDSVMHPFIAARGYACVRVDLQGSGDSDGALTGEYLPGNSATASRSSRGWPDSLGAPAKWA